MPQKDASLIDYLKTYALYPLPQHLLTRAIYWLTRQESSLTPKVIRKFASAFDVEMNDAVEPDLASYRTFNEFFTRALKPEARPIASAQNAIASPADGRISAVGNINEARVFQAKGRDYSLLSLLGGDGAATERLGNGRFSTIYLSPKDYHRLHMPLTGRLIRQTYVPGRLFSVGPHTVKTLPDLFARNERVIAQFETDHGLMALVLVGAMNVAAIETIWHGLVTPPQQKGISHIDYPANGPEVQLARGAEMGRFNMGSTIIVLLENPAAWGTDLQAGDSVRMGQLLGEVV
ncbi:Phosphatidylserine decarboxylase proenzyme [Granulosicoccus antarcticus IMCC3135]|uniref:Phosphatidylserine decarboxylase proenzyme n=1 Tax=Granulosicoccus antarcticus IMCC3135 TaxID=1192854 RepID=A0A2Z2P5X6_9GAMM|nr:archaetidylserine decarboxylase [Granulosicoccus antarcticus]ASJ75244.1 Phosphatidylserine decarboxylase proenzyme [Granulosicoccus antarcticus IMCC3135]